MKKLFTAIAIVCAMVMLTSVAACDNGGGNNSTPAGKTTYTVTFDTNGGSSVAAQTVEAGAYATRPSAPTKAGFAFTDWTKDAAGETSFDFATEAINGNTTVYAQWIDEASAATANFNLNYEGAGVYETKKFESGKRFKGPATNPERAGYYFAGWYTDTTYAEQFSDLKKYTGNQEFYAKWLKEFALEAEHTQLTDLPATDSTAVNGNKKGNGRSGEANGLMMIQKSDAASNGAFISGLYYTGAYLEFKITSSAAVDGVRLVARLACEFKDYALTSADLKFEVNETTVKYNTTINLKDGAPFADFVISTTVSLNEGENVIRVTVTNREKQFGDGTVNAAAPMVDCLKLYSTSEITMTKFNTEA